MDRRPSARRVHTILIPSQLPGKLNTLKRKTVPSTILCFNSEPALMERRSVYILRTPWRALYLDLWSGPLVTVGLFKAYVRVLGRI